MESVSGQTWKDFLQSRIFEPAGMYHTTAYASKMYGSSDAAIPCEHNGTVIEPCAVRKNDRVMHAAGGLGTSANDLAFQSSKTHLGFEQPQGWTRRAVERTAPTAMLLYTLIVCGSFVAVIVTTIRRIVPGTRRSATPHSPIC